MRVAVVFDNLGPYHVARIAGAARNLDILAVEVRGKSTIYDWGAPNLPANLDRTCLAPSGASRPMSWSSAMEALDERIGAFQPDAIALPGWSSLASLASIVWASDRGIPTIAMSDTNQADFRRTGVVEQAKRAIVRSFAAGLAAGDSAKNYLVALGLPESAVFLGYDVVDNSYFEVAVAAAERQRIMPALEGGERLDSRWWGRFFLASARFIQKKNLPALLDAYASYRQQCDNPEEAWPFVILGDGALRPALEARRRTLGLDGKVHLPGFIQYGDLPNYYAAAGAFVHASITEQWGLVVNEAMASGLPVAVSSRCGCAEMLVEEGVNGFTFDPYDTDSITKALVRLAGHPEPAALGRAGLSRIALWGPDRFGQGLSAAAEAACRRGAKTTSAATRLLIRVAATVQHHRG